MTVELHNFVDGKWVDAASGATFDVVDPATEEVIATAPDSKPEDVAAAIAAARRAFDDGIWSGRSERDREDVLLAAAAGVRRDADELARLEVMDSGKPLAEAREDIAEAAYMFEYFGTWITKMAGEIPPVGPDAMSLVVTEPVGVAGLITPWNYPLLMAVQKVAPALAAGCTCVLKPAEQTPLTALRLPDILAEAGLPPGVFNVVTGFGPSAGAPLVESPDVDKVGFTGSLEVGREVLRTSAETLKRVTLELGGKSPNLVFADASFEQAVEGTCNGIFGNQGEICSAGSRVLVERSIYDQVLEASVERARDIVVGPGLEDGTTMGPLVSKEQHERVLSYIDEGLREGARLATPKQDGHRSGYFVPPTIFYDVDPSMRIAREEIFGPVMAMMPFDSVDEAVSIANDSDYGLAAAIWTDDITKALRTARRLRAGTVWINDSQPAPTEAPWGGFKSSGIGRELGTHGIEDYLETKHIYINIAER